MQMIRDAITPERLDIVRKLFEREEAETEEARLARFSEELARKKETAAEARDRAAFAERQLAAARRALEGQGR